MTIDTLATVIRDRILWFKRRKEGMRNPIRKASLGCKIKALKEVLQLIGENNISDDPDYRAKYNESLKAIKPKQHD